MSVVVNFQMDMLSKYFLLLDPVFFNQLKKVFGDADLYYILYTILILILILIPYREWLRPGEEELVQRFDPSSQLDTIGFFIAKFAVGPKDNI